MGLVHQQACTKYISGSFFCQAGCLFLRRVFNLIFCKLIRLFFSLATRMNSLLASSSFFVIGFCPPMKSTSSSLSLFFMFSIEFVILSITKSSPLFDCFFTYQIYKNSCCLSNVLANCRVSLADSFIYISQLIFFFNKKKPANKLLH